MISEILNYCKVIENNRQLSDVFTHALSEIDELDEEIGKYYEDEAPGPDGIIGEAVDVILCMVDLIYQETPDVTEEQIREIVMKKCEKWKEIYHESN